MADDPRIEPVEEYIHSQFGVDPSEANLAALAILGEADMHDPLHILVLPDEDRAVDAIADALKKRRFGAATPSGNEAVEIWRDAFAVLAVLRKEANR